MLTPVDEIVAVDDEETTLLRAMAVKAREYITSFKWSLPIKAMYLADGVGKIVALFLVEFEGKIGGTDGRLWVVVGDLPSAYMVVDEGPSNAKAALEAYCELMDDWLNAILVTRNFENVFPVDAARTTGNAESLRWRLQFVRQNVIPSAPTDPVD